MQVYYPIYSVVLAEVPGEISIGFQVRGCGLKCPGCSYRSLERFGYHDLSLSEFETILEANSGLATAVVFMGGDWCQDFVPMLQRARIRGFKTCLYSGLTDLDMIDQRLLERLDFVKTGRWLGIPISDPNSNQRFYSLPDRQDLSVAFRR